MNFGNNLKAIRKSKKISQETLAEKVGVSRQSVSKWECGEAYPEMNNILELCKIFHCHINDLVQEQMNDIDSLDEEIKMNVVKFKKEQQKKMKILSKAIYIISRIVKIISLMSLIIVSFSLVVAPIMVKKLTITNNQIMIDSHQLFTDDIEVYKKLEDVLTAHTDIELIFYAEVICISFMICIFLLIKIFASLEKLFVNIHEGDTPFTLENITYIKKIAKLIILSFLLPNIMGYIMQWMIGVDLEVEFEVFDLLFVLVIFCIAYIFEYGYQIQKDSKGIMYEKE